MANAKSPNQTENTRGTPTPLAVRRDPEYWLNGPGRSTARATECEHGYLLTDSCPCCP